MNRFPVLMYHRVASDRCPVPNDDAEESRYAVTLADFTWQLDRISRHGRTGVSMARIVECLDSGRDVPAHWIGITFDDGNESDYAHALPLLSERGFTATFYVCANRVDEPGGLTRTMVRELVFAGQHVGAHGMTHRFLTALDASAEEDEIVQSRDLLAELTDAPVDHFAPPGGRYSERTVETLRRHSFRAVGTSEFGFNPCSGRRFLFRRIPVTGSMSRSRFDATVQGKTLSLFPLYARAKALAWVRRILGESGYRRLRSLAVKR
jgi:peptidoglycan/xylan/chitin deacetylase (PgdA/CDA1 family)